MIKKLILISLLIFLFNDFSIAQNNRLKNYNLEGKLAIQGYDPVAYFKYKKAKKGSKNYQHTYKGVTYYFASNSSKSTFKSNPSKYEPAYGGWCAYAMGSSGKKVAVDPSTFKILNGKLHLFYNFWGTNTLTKWNKNQTKLKKKADLNWKKFF